MPQTAPSSAPDEQFLLVTLMAKLAVVATLATMLVRFRWFRRILLTERRDWPERLVFAAGLGMPAHGGRRARGCSSTTTPRTSRSPGAFLAGLIAGPYAGALVGAAVGLPAALRRRIRRAALRGRLRVRRRRPARDLSRRRRSGGSRRSSSPRCIGRPGALVRNFSLDWQVMLVTAPVLLELLRQQIGARYRPHSASSISGRTTWWHVPAHRRWPPCCAWPSRSRSGTARASSTGSPSRKSC